VDGGRESKEKKARNFGSKIKIERVGGSLRGGSLDDIKLDLNEDYCSVVG
jgi:hypothetical protein